MISEQDKSAIRMLLQSPGWKSALQVAEGLASKWQSQSKRGDTEWDTAANVMSDEGKCEGVKVFIQELNKHAQHD